MFEVVFFIVILIVSIILHELGHGYAAFLQGDNTPKEAGRLTFNPLPHLDPFGSLILPGFLIFFGSSFLFGWAKPMPYNPYNLRLGSKGEALVASAGVMVNIALALLVAGVYWIFSSSVGAYEEIFFLAVFLNIFLAIINLIPVPPLDGYRIVTQMLPVEYRNNLLHLEENIVARFSFFSLFAIAFFFLFVLVGPLADFALFLSYLLI